MSKNTSSVPDAWDDDDWVRKADTGQSQQPIAVPTILSKPKLSRAERKAAHEQANKELWQSADAEPEVPIFLQARASQPGTNFSYPSPINPAPTVASGPSIKPAIKVLSRRAPPPATKPDDEPDSEEEEKARAATEFAERQAKAARDREEKLARYAARREELLGSRSDSPTSANADGRNSPAGPGSSGSRERGRGGYARGGSRGNSSGKRTEIKPIREPRGAESGKGFAPRGGKQ